MRYFTKIALIALILIFAVANSADAGIVNNSTSSFTAADSICLSFALLDSLGSVTALDSAADWFKIFVFNPAGDSVFGESLSIKQTEAQIELYKVATVDAMWTYKREVEDFDGSNVTQNGVWRWYALARDSSLKLTTSWTGEFQLYTTGDINVKWDSTTQIPTGEVTTGSFTAGAIDAAAIAASAIGESELAAGSITTSEIATGAVDADAVADDAIDAGAIAASAIGASEIASAAIAADEIAADAIGASELATDAIGAAEIGANAITDAEVDNGVTLRANAVAISSDSVAADSLESFAENAYLNSGAGTARVRSDMVYYEGQDGVDAEIQSEVEDGVNAATDINTIITQTDGIEPVTNLLTFTGLSGGVDANVMDWGGANITPSATGGAPDVNIAAVSGNTTADNGLAEAFDNDNTFTTGGFEAVVDSINPVQKGQQADSTWGTGHSASRELTALDEDNTTLDLNATTIGTVTNLTNNNPNLDGATGTIANSQVDDDVDVNTKTVTSGAIDSVDFAADARTGLLSLAPWRQDTSNAAWDGNLAKFGEWNAQAQTAVSSTSPIWSDTLKVLIHRTDSLMRLSRPDSVIYRMIREVWRNQDTVNVDTSKIGAWLMANIDRINSTDTVARVNSTDAGDTIRAHAPHGNNWASTAIACGTGSQAVTIYVIDTSGTDELVSSFVTIYNSAVTSTQAFGTAMGGIAGTYGLSASTAYKGLAVATGYYFPLYSFTTGSGASHTDTIRGYDIPTSAGSSVPSGQQVQLYDWATVQLDTLYGARVAITLVGSSNFYTSTNLSPAATIVVYAGANDGTSNGGRWQETVFNTDSLFAPGGATPTYHIEITHPLLDLSGSKIVYSGVRVPYSASAVRLRTLISQQ